MTNRTCHVCGNRYYYCSSYNCERSRNKPKWMVMFDEENCFRIWKILSARFENIRKANDLFKFQQITESQLNSIISEETKNAAIKLRECDLSGLENFIPQIRKEVNEILDSEESKNLDVPTFLQGDGLAIDAIASLSEKDSKKTNRKKDQKI